MVLSCWQDSVFCKTIGILVLPVPTIPAHFLNAALCTPAQLLPRLGGIRVAGGDVAGTAGCDGIGYFDAVGLLSSRQLALLPSPFLRTALGVFPHTVLQTVCNIRCQIPFCSVHTLSRVRLKETLPRNF